MIAYIIYNYTMSALFRPNMDLERIAGLTPAYDEQLTEIRCAQSGGNPAYASYFVFSSNG